MQLGLTVSRSDETRITQVIHTLTVVGTLTYVGWALWLFQQLYRASQLGATRTGTVWEERIESLSVLATPITLPTLAVPAAAAATATWLAGPLQQLELAILLRLVRWSATATVLVGIAATIETIFGSTGGIDQADVIAFRLGGVAIAAGIAYLCLRAGRTAPGG